MRSCSEILKRIHSPLPVSILATAEIVTEILISLSPFLSSTDIHKSFCVSLAAYRFSLSLTPDTCERWVDKSFTEAAEHSGRSPWPRSETPVRKSWFFYKLQILPLLSPRPPFPQTQNLGIGWDDPARFLQACFSPKKLLKTASFFCLWFYSLKSWLNLQLFPHSSSTVS